MPKTAHGRRTRPSSGRPRRQQPSVPASRRPANPANPPNPPKPATSAIAAILAGGLSSRMGRDKARLRLQRQSLLACARAAARAAGLKSVVIRRDRIPRCGPLGGIHTALTRPRADVTVFLACDMPFVPPPLLQRLLKSLRTNDLAVFTTLNGTAGFPFALRTACAAPVKAQILKGRFSLQQLARTLRARRLKVRPAERAGLTNINTPEDLATARHLARRRPAPPRA